MTIYLTNRDGGKTDEAGHYQFLASGFSGNVLNGLTLVQTNPLGMKLNLTAGNARIPYGGYAYSAFVQEGETHEVQIGTANPSNPRIDRVVMYIDRAMARQTVNPNNPGIAKIAVVAGTPAGSPVRPSDVSVNTAVGNNPWIDLADVRVNTGVTQITTANVTDKRVMASAVLGPKAVTADKIDFTTFSDTNPGTAGGSRNYISLGGLKFCWGNCSVPIDNALQSARVVTFPVGFFSTQPSVAMSGEQSGTIFIQPNIGTVNAGGFNCVVNATYNTNATGSIRFFWVAIGA